MTRRAAPLRRHRTSSEEGLSAAQRASAGGESGLHVDEGGCRRLVWLAAYRYAAPPEPYCRSSAWRLGRAAVVVADGMAAAAAARPSLRPQFRSRRARGSKVAHTPYALSPQRLSVLAVPLRGVFQVLTTQGDRGQNEIDCALADPHLPRLLGGAPQLFTTTLVYFRLRRALRTAQR